MDLIEQNSIAQADAVKAEARVEFGYEPSLDGLRGIAILAVMAFNGHVLLMEGGFVGVDIFFVLSGFLITSLLIRDQSRISILNLKNFYIRRALRLLPALLVLMLFCVGYALLVQPKDKAASTLWGIVYTALYVNNWAQVSQPGVGPLSHAWSLSVEEQFYIVWPLIVLILVNIKKKSWVLAILSLLILASLVTSISLWLAKESYFRMYFGSDTRAQELLIGCVAAMLFSWGMVRRQPRLKSVFHIGASISLIGISLSFFLARYNAAFVYNGGFTLVCLGTAVLILDLLLFPSSFSRLFEFRPLVWIGKISYGLYLWHYPIFEASNRLFKDRMNPLAAGVIGLAFTIFVATVSYYVVEQPFLKLKRRYSKTKPHLASQPLPSWTLNTADAETGGS